MSDEKILNADKNAMKKINPHIYDQGEYDINFTGSHARVSFVRKINGIFAPDNGFIIVVDKNTGELLLADGVWWDVEYPSK